MGGPQQAPKGAGCAVRVTRQYLFCLARMRTPLVRNVARTLPRLSGRPRTLPPPRLLWREETARGERRLLVPVCRRCRRLCDEAFIFLPARLGGMAVLASQYARVAGGLGDRRPPSTHPTGFAATETTYVLCAKGSTHGGQATEQNSGEAATASCGSAGGQEELFRC